MISDPVRRIRVALAAELEILSPPARVALAHQTVETTGGTFVPPHRCGNWGSHWAELSLLGVSATGDDEPEAVAHWIRAVLRMERDRQKAQVA